MRSCYTLSETELELSIFAKTHARKTAIAGVDQQHLHISLHAKPEEGKANIELIKFLSEYFKIPKTQIVLRHGKQSRYKKVVCRLEKNQRTTRAEIIEQLTRLLSKLAETDEVPEPHRNSEHQ
ncbi:MAG: DUF167 domain-containing protein [Chthoniobacterales bacterium]|nr:DUF167 domain-containing protein [Chthoniobacterales bacterium]